MKKVLMIAAVACMATFAQALTIDWTSNTTIPFNANGINVRLVYSSSEDNLADVYANIANYAEATGASISDYSEGVAGQITLADTNTLPTASSTYYVFCNDGANVYGASFGATAANWEGNTVGGDDYGATPVPFIATLNFEKVAVVPEPTALALLALGVAGVALRRRRRA